MNISEKNETKAMHSTRCLESYSMYNFNFILFRNIDKQFSFEIEICIFFTSEPRLESDQSGYDNLRLTADHSRN